MRVNPSWSIEVSMGSNIRDNRLAKSTSIIAFIATLVAILVAYLNPATLYELSIYSSTPTIVWILLLFSTLLALLLILFSLIRNKIVSSYWVVGVLILFLNRIFIQWMPYIRGYYTLSGDQMSQIGTIIDLLNNGYISQDNFYPITHIMISELISITGIQTLFVSNLSTALMSAFCVFSIFIFAQFILKNKIISIFATTSAIAVLFSGYDLYLMPNGWSIFIIPIILYTFLKLRENKNIQWTVLIILFLLSLPFYHPLTSIMMIVILFVSGFADYLLRTCKLKNFNIIELKNSIPLNQIFILSTTILMWILSFRLFNANILAIYDAITSGSGPFFLNELGEGSQKLNFSTMELISFIIKSIGHILIFLLLSSIAFVYYIKNKYYAMKNDSNMVYIFSITGVFIILYIGFILNFIPGLHAIGGSRILAYLIIFTPIIVGWIFKIFYDKNKIKKFSAGFFMVIVFSASILSALALNPSPYTESPGAHIAISDVKTSSWLFSKTECSINVSSIVSPLHRYSHLIYGETNGNEKIHEVQNIPDHFGYGNYRPSLNLSKGTYIVLNSIDKQIYTTVWTPVGRFTNNDFIQLSSDSLVNKIYSNIGSEIWAIQ